MIRVTCAISCLIAACVQITTASGHECFTVVYDGASKQPVIYSPGTAPDRPVDICLTHAVTECLLQDGASPSAPICYRDTDTGFVLELTAPCRFVRTGLLGTHGYYQYDMSHYYLRLVVPPNLTTYSPLKYRYPQFVPLGGTNGYLQTWKHLLDSQCELKAILKNTTFPSEWCPEKPAADGWCAISGHRNIPKAAVTLWNEFITVCPKTFPETLAYEYGLENGSIDVLPGMRLRVEAAPYIDYGKQTDPSFFWGHGAATTTMLYVTRSESGLSFDPYLNLMNGTFSRMTSPETATNDVVAGTGAVDLHLGAHGARKFYRLVYPEKYYSARAEGAKDPVYTVVLVGGNTRAEMSGDSLAKEIDERSFAQSQPYVAKSRPSGRSGGSDNEEKLRMLTFWGRSVVIPEVIVTQNKERAFLPIGTTLRSRIEQIWNVDELYYDNPDTLSQKMYLRRRFRGELYPVYFLSSDASVFGIPLLKGDEIQ